MIDEYIDEINLKIQILKEQIGQSQHKQLDINSKTYGFEHISNKNEGYLYLLDKELAGVLRYEQVEPCTFLITNTASRKKDLRVKLFYLFADYLVNYTKYKNETVVVASPDELSDRIFEEKGFEKEKWSFRQFLRAENEYRFSPSSQR